jgi:hypothetical protein
MMNQAPQLRMAWVALKVFSSELSTFLKSDVIDDMSRSRFLSNDLKVELVSLGAALHLLSTVLPLPHERCIWSLSEMEGLLPMGKVAFDTAVSQTHAFHNANCMLKVAHCGPFIRVYNAWAVFRSKITDARVVAGGEASTYISSIAELIYGRLQRDPSVVSRMETNGLEAYRSRFSTTLSPGRSSKATSDADGKGDTMGIRYNEGDSATADSGESGEEGMPLNFSPSTFWDFETGVETPATSVESFPFEQLMEGCASGPDGGDLPRRCPVGHAHPHARDSSF